ncbi:MAG: hypothetical protein PHU49_08010 [Syntrophorhabdaceae bacterium]|nr:hypothetical protein [Syntrophorhabdaceae bacterium]MDD5243948.1 hypothetical protein [Syntrophorhabdaceae bacterium]
MKTKIERMFDDIRVGRKAIIAYLRPFLNLPMNEDSAWQKVKRYRKNYVLPVERFLNGKPFVDPYWFKYWFLLYTIEADKRRRNKALRGLRRGQKGITLQGRKKRATEGTINE